MQVQNLWRTCLGVYFVGLPYECRYFYRLVTGKLLLVDQLLWPTLCYMTAVRSNYFMQQFEVGAQVERLDLRNRGSTVIGWSKYTVRVFDLCCVTVCR
jgi:hypothetical protein